jgi:hypothetical protein
MFISLDFSLNTSRAIKKGGVKILKTEYAVFVYYKLESKYKNNKSAIYIFEYFEKKNLETS